MGVLMTTVLSVLAILAGIGLVFVARPNAAGQSPAFLKSHLMQMNYPVFCLGLIVVGLAFLITELGVGS